MIMARPIVENRFRSLRTGPTTHRSKFCQYPWGVSSDKLDCDDLNTTFIVEIRKMKVLWMIACLFIASASNGQTAVVVNPNTGKAAVAHTNQNGVTTTQTTNGGKAKSKNGVAVVQGPGGNTAVVNQNTGKATVAHTNGATATQTTNAGRSVVQGPGGTTAAVNTRTGKAAVAHTNQNGVTTTQTTNGGKAKSKNGMGVAQGPGGTTCVKGPNQQGCKK